MAKCINSTLFLLAIKDLSIIHIFYKPSSRLFALFFSLSHTLYLAWETADFFDLFHQPSESSQTLLLNIQQIIYRSRPPFPPFNLSAAVSYASLQRRSPPIKMGSGIYAPGLNFIGAALGGLTSNAINVYDIINFGPSQVFQRIPKSRASILGRMNELNPDKIQAAPTCFGDDAVHLCF